MPFLTVDDRVGKVEIVFRSENGVKIATEE